MTGPHSYDAIAVPLGGHDSESFDKTLFDRQDHLLLASVMSLVEGMQSVCAYVCALSSTQFVPKGGGGFVVVLTLSYPLPAESPIHRPQCLHSSVQFVWRYPEGGTGSGFPRLPDRPPGLSRVLVTTHPTHPVKSNHRHCRSETLSLSLCATSLVWGGFMIADSIPPAIAMASPPPHRW